MLHNDAQRKRIQSEKNCTGGYATMTDKELRKLKRTELLELLYYLRKELDTVKQENETLRKQLEEQSAAQADVKEALLETVRKTAQQVQILFDAQNAGPGRSDAEETAKEQQASTEADAETEPCK